MKTDIKAAVEMIKLYINVDLSKLPGTPKGHKC